MNAILFFDDHDKLAKGLFQDAPDKAKTMLESVLPEDRQLDSAAKLVVFCQSSAIPGQWIFCKKEFDLANNQLNETSCAWWNGTGLDSQIAHDLGEKTLIFCDFNFDDWRVATKPSALQIAQSLNSFSNDVDSLFILYSTRDFSGAKDHLAKMQNATLNRLNIVPYVLELNHYSPFENKRRLKCFLEKIRNKNLFFS